jgi:hypothetical protein
LRNLSALSAVFLLLEKLSEDLFFGSFTDEVPELGYILTLEKNVAFPVSAALPVDYTVHG